MFRDALGANFVNSKGYALTNSIHYLDENKIIYPVGK
jgi:hypothetical protein